MQISGATLNFYRAFGLSISSELVLPELAASFDTKQTSQDVGLSITLIDEGSESWRPLVSDVPHVKSGADWAELDFPGAGRFRVDAGARRIECHASPGAGALVRLPLLGPVMATYLHLQGKLVLHASAVEVDQGSIAFLGDKGAGKSTTAAAFIRHGFHLVTDDLLVCHRAEQGGFGCSYAYPQLKLTPDSHAALPVADALDLAPPFPGFAKIQQRLAPQKQTRTDPPHLRAVCVLLRDERLSVQRASREEALTAALRFAYVLRYGAAFSAHGHGAGLFRSAAALAGEVPCLRLTLPSQLDELDAAVPAAFELIQAACKAF